MGFAISDMKVTSASFKHGGAIPARHTGEGDDVSPTLMWSSPPQGTKSFAVICHDPDAPKVSHLGDYGFVHWVLYNIPGSVTRLEEGTADYAKGNNDFGKAGYGGPMPPKGHGTHHYFFWVLALDLEPDLEDGLSMRWLLEKVEPHVLGMSRLMGTYIREA